MNRRAKSVFGAAAVLVALVGFLGTAAHAAAPAPPFHQCPAVGADTACGILIVINPDGSTAAYADPANGPYDNVEDSLIGVQNNSAFSISNLPLSGPGIFGFDGDGLCIYLTSAPAGCYGPTGYEGPNTSFTVVDGDHGSVNFTGGLGAGKSAYFSLEEVVTPGSIVLPAASQLVADPAIVQVGPSLTLNLPNLVAHLSSGGHAVANEMVRFTTTKGVLICTGKTNAAGTASCGGSLTATLSLELGYTASFAGDATRSPQLLGSSAHGTLVTALGIKLF